MTAANVLDFTSALSAGTLSAARLCGEEGISELFRFEVDLGASDPDIDFDALVGKPACVALALAGADKRYYHGIVTRFGQTGGGVNSASYRAVLRPWLWWLTLHADCRIFQQLSVPDILAKLFRELGFTAFRNQLQGSYAVRDYCVQYGETAFDFVSRLMEDEGIFYYFEHTADDHTMVLVDTASSFVACPRFAGPARYQGTGVSRDALDLVYECAAERRAVTAAYAVEDWDYNKPAQALRSKKDGDGAPAMRVYDYPGGYTAAADGDARAAIRMQELGQSREGIQGRSTCRAFTSGYTMAMSAHPRAKLNDTYVLRRVHHEASAAEYNNHFDAFRVSQPFRPARKTPRARIYGTQTAMVVGPSGEEIHTDSLGRIKVQFHWDQHGKKDDKSSCWIRVAQGWAGAGWGAFFLPRVGQEVVVSFLEGDPDRPLVTGSVYNGTGVPPDALPANKTRSAIRSSSSPGGEGANEIGMEDKKGSEELYLHAQKDMTVKVENDRNTTLVKGNDMLLVGEGTRSVTVTGDETHTNKANFDQKVTGNFTLKVDGDLTLDVTGSVTIKSGASLAIQASQAVTTKAGTSLTAEAGTALTNKAGTSLDNKAGTTLTNDAGISLTNKGAASQTVDGGGMLTLKGGIVKIN
jgi:type VI secretion system secreted protein VgrG